MSSEKVRHSDLGVWGGRVEPLGCMLKKKPNKNTTNTKKTQTDHTHTKANPRKGESDSYALSQSRGVLLYVTATEF